MSHLDYQVLQQSLLAVHLFELSLKFWRKARLWRRAI